MKLGLRKPKFDISKPMSTLSRPPKRLREAQGTPTNRSTHLPGSTGDLQRSPGTPPGHPRGAQGGPQGARQAPWEPPKTAAGVCRVPPGLDKLPCGFYHTIRSPEGPPEDTSGDPPSPPGTPRTPPATPRTPQRDPRSARGATRGRPGGPSAKPKGHLKDYNNV